MTKKNLLIGFGETLTTTVTPPRGGGGKTHPYTFRQAQSRLQPQLSALRHRIEKVPSQATPNDRVVARFTLHPAYLAKTYFPENIFTRSGLENIGSKGTQIKPEVSTNSKIEGEQATTVLYMAGQAENFSAFDAILATAPTKALQREFTKFESIDYFEPKSKIKYLNPAVSSHDLEVVLQTGNNADLITDYFLQYAQYLGCTVDTKRRLHSGGLVFIPVTADDNAIEPLAEYTHLRAVRELADLRIQKPNIFRRSLVKAAPKLPTESAINQDVSVAIFDGGVGVSDLDKWCQEITYHEKHTNADYLSHGQEVTSAVLFGHIKEEQTKLPIPFCKIDHYRVIDPTSNKDVDLFDVLIRIKEALTSRHYHFANISLGPRLPVEDDDVHTWTAILDELSVTTGTLISIAIGNDGDLEEGQNRIQPPSDMVNGLAVGSADSASSEWGRAEYSCVGPGRSPGLVKPDGLAFGGSLAQPVRLMSPMSKTIVETAGTSFASPLALRCAIGAYTEVSTPISPLTTKALMVHFARDNNLPRPEVGWGRFPDKVDDLLYCDDTEATIIYQGDLAPGKCLRADIPYPSIAMKGNIEINATFCYFSQLDPEHSGNYTRSGLEIVFHNDKNNMKKTTSFFKQKDMFETEQEARSDAHKWETTLKNKKGFRATSLNDPSFFVTYHTREKSHGANTETLPALPYVLVVTISQKNTKEIYNNILQRYQTLQPIKVRQDIRIRG